MTNSCTQKALNLTPSNNTITKQKTLCSIFPSAGAAVGAAMQPKPTKKTNKQTGKKERTQASKKT